MITMIRGDIMTKHSPKLDSNKVIQFSSSSDDFLHEQMTRMGYFVTQHNDLAKSFGRLNKMDNKVADYFSSFVTQKSKKDEQYVCRVIEFMELYNFKKSEYYYKSFKNSCSNLMSHKITVLDKNGYPTIIPFIRRYKSLGRGKISFQFSEEIIPFLIGLKKNYYSIHLSELAKIRSKYTLIFVKLWASYRHGENNVTNIKGSLDDWERWFLGPDKHWSAGRFKQKVLTVSLNEMLNKFPLKLVSLDEYKNRSKTVGYRISLKGKPDYKLRINKK